MDLTVTSAANSPWIQEHLGNVCQLCLMGILCYIQMGPLAALPFLTSLGVWHLYLFSCIAWRETSSPLFGFSVVKDNPAPFPHCLTMMKAIECDFRE